MATEFKLPYTGSQISEKLGKIDSLALKSEIPTKVSQLTNDKEYLTSVPVTSVNNKTGAVNLTASDVGALPNTTEIPDALADLASDSTHRTVTDAEKESWNAKSNFSGSYNDLTNKPTIPSIEGLASESYVDNKIAAIPTPDVSGQINTHNTSDASHNDIRLLIDGLTSRLNALADSDDTTLDQMSEIVTYIKSNNSLIESVTTNKVNVSDIIDNLTTNVANKPLSAAQGVALKALIDAITVPTKTSQLTNDSGYLTSAPITSVNSKTGAVTLMASDVGADASGTASSLVSAHNTATDAHADIRGEIAAVNAKIVSEVITMTQAQYNSMTQTQFSTLYKQGVRIIAVEVTDSDSGTTVTYINRVPISVDENGDIFNGVGWIEKTRLSSTGATKEIGYASTTGYIVASSGAVIRIKGVDYDKEADYICAYKSDYTFIGATNGTCTYTALGTLTRDDDVASITLPNNSDIAWVRVSAMHDVSDAGFDKDNIDKAMQGPGPYLIVTVNQEIT